MLEPIVLAVSTGTWITLGIIGALLVLGLIALAASGSEPRGVDTEVVYVFGLSKYPRLVPLPQARDLPATLDPLEGQGLRDLASDAGAKSGFETDRYELPDGRKRPYELSEDLPDGIQAIELTRDGLRVRIDRDGEVRANRSLDEEERIELEDLLLDVVGEADARADRRTWAPPAHTPEEANVKRA